MPTQPNQNNQYSGQNKQPQNQPGQGKVGNNTEKDEPTSRAQGGRNMDSQY